jgi:glycosyltransferase involved in cell wall biosynthesis
MYKVKISLITVSYNAANTIQRCIDSVVSQTYPNIEYVIIDGNSSDGTWQIILNNEINVHYFRSERDHGIYDAMNKGISYCTGDIIGTLNADDYFANDNVLNDIAQSFEQSRADLLYADLDYVNDDGKVMRKWRSGHYHHRKFNWGWMPPHPTFYARRAIFERFGLYSFKYGTAADYELMLRFMYLNTAKVFYLNKVIVKMAMGGVSNQKLRNRVAAWRNDFNAMKHHKISIPILGIVLKPIRKLIQFI